MIKALETINIHTLIRKLLQPNIPGTLSSWQTTSRDAMHTQHIEITHHHNVNSKLVFHKVASFPQYYSTVTLQTYHHSYHRFRPWPMHMASPSHLHAQARVQPINTYSHNYIKYFSWTKQNTLALYIDKITCTLFTPDPVEYKSNLDFNIINTALPIATHSKFSVPILDPKHTAHTFTTSQYRHTRHYT